MAKSSTSWKPGERPKGAGKPKGTENKRTKEIREELEALGMGKTFENPVVWMARVYAGSITLPVVIKTPDGETIADRVASPEIRSKCAAEVAQYLFPKRKAMELSGADGQDLGIYLMNASTVQASGIGVKGGK
jgi:hypothetical protein